MEKIKILRLLFLTVMFSVVTLSLFIFSGQNVKASTDLIAHWNFNEGSGNTANDIINGYNGVNVGATWISNGVKKGAISFNGTDDYIVIDSMSEMNSFTMMFWVKSNGWNTGWGRIFSTTKLNDTSTTKKKSICKNFEISKSYDIGAFGYYGLGNEWDGLNFNVSNSWSHITFANNGSELNIYKNGILQETLSVSCGIPKSKWFFGIAHSARYNTYSEGSNISLDEFKVYNKALTSSEILTEYNNDSCTKDIWTCSGWSKCSSYSQQTRSCTITKECSAVETSSPMTTQSCTFVPPVCNDWKYSNWSDCSITGKQVRSVINSLPDNCVGGSPILNQSCNYFPVCTASDWSCGSWGKCSTNNTKTRTCNKTTNCKGGVSAPATSQSCAYIPACTSYNWSCESWGKCSTNNTKTRTCSKTTNCKGGVASPVTTQSCTYIPPCNADTWTCDAWGSCSSQGIQTRSCKRTFDCPSVETAVPPTSQYCEAPNKPKHQTPSADLDIVNQSSIIKSTVKLICPVSRTMASQGSGTVINSNGTILTNKHVIAGTVGCLVGFIDDYDDEPYFGDRHIADIYKVSSNNDVAILKLRNPSKKKLTSIEISKGNSNNLSLGEQFTTYGYPAKFGTKITYTSGDFSGVDGNYLKTTAIIEYGNSGGGAYLKNGTFIGIPSAVVKGKLNSLGYILSINTINAWLGNSVVAYSNTTNNYSRVSVLEDIDLNKLGSLKLFIPTLDKNSNVVISTTTQNTQITTSQPRVGQQKESVIIESNKNTSSTQSTSSTSPEQPKRMTLIKRFFSWLSNLFDKLISWS